MTKLKDLKPGARFYYRGAYYRKIGLTRDRNHHLVRLDPEHGTSTRTSWMDGDNEIFNRPDKGTTTRKETGK